MAGAPKFPPRLCAKYRMVDCEPRLLMELSAPLTDISTRHVGFADSNSQVDRAGLGGGPVTDTRPRENA